MSRQAPAWLALIGAVGCSESAAPLPPGPTLTVSNRAYDVICSPVCMPAAPVDPLYVGIWHDIPSDTIILALVVPFDSSACVRLPGWIGERYGWTQIATGFSLEHGALYYSGDAPTDLSTSPGWLWTISDTVVGTYSIEHHATFEPTPACDNPITLP